jgi:hypothetical protein
LHLLGSTVTPPSILLVTALFSLDGQLRSS